MRMGRITPVSGLVAATAAYTVFHLDVSALGLSGGNAADMDFYRRASAAEFPDLYIGICTDKLEPRAALATAATVVAIVGLLLAVVSGVRSRQR
jgi:hypothetical protein